ncbi:cysteine proteinase [Theileria orientalis]|uniref:Cysteine proteinase n=1 Tax=Theileria orientalis TaxID=68886 RepID=A0A976QVH0_THEOR|nr:cysteine proteinase [Theileria orientalis]
MEQIDPIKIDAIERVDTESVLVEDNATQKKGFGTTVTALIKRYSAIVVIVLAAALFITTFITIVLSSGRSTVKKNKELLSKEFEKLEFDNFVTIKDQKEEDFTTLIAEVLYKVAIEFDPKEEALIYLQYNQFNKDYARKHTSYRHKKTAFTNYRNNLNEINQHNKKDGVTFTKSMNRFGDLSAKEFMKKYTLKLSLNLPKDKPVSYNNERPMSVDLRTHGFMTPVKAQQEGEFSWAYSTVAVTESYVKKMTQKTVNLSENQLVDCVQTKGTPNNPVLGYKYVKDLGLYKSELVEKAKTKCPDLNEERFKLPSYSYTYDPDLVALMLNAGPLTVPVALNEEWQFYADGTMNVCGPELNHFATLVGVSFDEKGNHWILKNSFGQDWGSKGYVLLERNSKEFKNDCGLTSFAIYAV